MLLLIAVHLPLWADDTLIVAYGSYNAAPYIVKDATGAVSSGIFYDIAVKLAENLSCTIRFKEVPRKRLVRAIQEGTVHIYLKGNTSWVDDSTLFFWSIPLFEERDILLCPDSLANRITSREGVKGLTVGTQLGYRYRVLDSCFKAGLCKRDDVTSLWANVQKLQMGRVDCLIDSDIIIYYQLKQRGITGLKSALWIPETYQLRSMLSPLSPVSVAEIDRVYEKMKREGLFREILDRYR